MAISSASLNPERRPLLQSSECISRLPLPLIRHVVRVFLSFHRRLRSPLRLGRPLKSRRCRASRRATLPASVSIVCISLLDSGLFLPSCCFSSGFILRPQAEREELFPGLARPLDPHRNPHLDAIDQALAREVGMLITSLALVCEHRQLVVPLLPLLGSSGPALPEPGFWL